MRVDECRQSVDECRQGVDECRQGVDECRQVQIVSTLHKSLIINLLTTKSVECRQFAQLYLELLPMKRNMRTDSNTNGGDASRVHRDRERGGKYELH